MEKQDLLIGKTVKTNDGRKVKIKSQRNIGGEDIYTDEEGNIYTEDDLDIRYVLTPGRILFNGLADMGIVGEEDWDGNLYKDIIDRFFENMERAGYVNKEGGCEE